MTLVELVWLVALLLQGHNIWLVIAELRSRYGSRWSWKWGLMGAAMLLMLGWCLYNLLWLHADVAIPAPVVLFPYFWCLLAILLGLYLHITRIIYAPIAPLAPIPPAIILMDGASVVLTWNAQATRLFGWTAAEAVGRSLPTLIIPEALQQAHRDGVARFLARPADTRTLKEQYFPVAQHKNGTAFQVEVIITALPQPDGTVQFLGSIRKLLFL